MTTEGLKLCAPRVEYAQDPSGVLYFCGATVLLKDATDPEQACPNHGATPEHWKGPTGTILCGDCVDVFKDFMNAAHDARARRKEWDDA